MAGTGKNNVAFGKRYKVKADRPPRRTVEDFEGSRERDCENLQRVCAKKPLKPPVKR